MARHCNSAHIFGNADLVTKLPKLSYLELHPLGMSRKMTGRFSNRDDIHFIWGKLVKNSFLKDLTEASIAISNPKRTGVVVLNEPKELP